MDIQILALDLDGTLLTNHNSVSPACCAAVQAARAKGVQAVICTGRNAADSCLFGEMAGGMDWAITANGAEVRSLADDEILLTEPLGKPLCEALLALCGEFDVDPCLYTAEAVYYGRAFEQFMEVCAGQGLRLKFTERRYYHRIPDGSWKGFLAEQSEKILKAILYDSDPVKVDRIYEALLRDGRFEAAPSEMFGGRLKNVEVNRRGVSKGRALQALADRTGCTMAQVMAIGDSDNDLTMLRMAGLGVAMGNAPEHIRLAADAVTADNAEDGVARAIEKWIL